MGDLIRYDQRRWEQWKRLALDSVTSPHSRRAYETALDHFAAWYSAEPRPSLSKAVVNAYKVELEAAGFFTSTINVRLCALRKLAFEAADNGLMATELAASIAKLRGAPLSTESGWGIG
jgi:site-specific recombinase XerD